MLLNMNCVVADSNNSIEEATKVVFDSESLHMSETIITIIGKACNKTLVLDGSKVLDILKCIEVPDVQVPLNIGYKDSKDAEVVERFAIIKRDRIEVEGIDSMTITLCFNVLSMLQVLVKSVQ